MRGLEWKNLLSVIGLINCTRGVKQCDVCSPVLFSLAINDRALEVVKLTVPSLAAEYAARFSWAKDRQGLAAFKKTQSCTVSG